MSLIAKAREFFRPGGLACPRCEKPIEGHDEKACEHRMSRRYFFGALAAGVAVVALPKTLPKPLDSGVAIAHRAAAYPLPEHQHVAEFWVKNFHLLGKKVSSQIAYCIDVDGVKFWPKPDEMERVASVQLVEVFESAVVPPSIPPWKAYGYPVESKAWAEDNLKPGAVFTMDVSYIENAPSRARRCPAYNEHTGKWDNHKEPRRLPE